MGRVMLILRYLQAEKHRSPLLYVHSTSHERHQWPGRRSSTRRQPSIKDMENRNRGSSWPSQRLHVNSYDFRLQYRTYKQLVEIRTKVRTASKNRRSSRWRLSLPQAPLNHTTPSSSRRHSSRVCIAMMQFGWALPRTRCILSTHLLINARASARRPCFLHI